MLFYLQFKKFTSKQDIQYNNFASGDFGMVLHM